MIYDSVVFDIDQDFFFNVKKDAERPSEQLRYKKDFVQTIDVRSLLIKYRLFEKPYYIFRSHEEAYWKIKELNLKNIKLLHFDAHDDLDRA